MSASLPLRGVHLPPPPSWWPPAPGWWLLAVLMLAMLAIPLLRYWRGRRRRALWQRHFNETLDAAAGANARLAALAGLLRRAARERHAGDELLQGREWLQVIDPQGALDAGQQALLLEGAYRREVDATALAALERWAAACFLELVAGRRP